MFDGMLVWYQSQASEADTNVERLMDRMPFDFRDYLQRLPGPEDDDDEYVSDPIGE